MNILASYNWMKEYLHTDLSAADFGKEFSLRSMSVERVEKLSHRYANIVVGVISTVEPHANADRLRVCMVDVGESELAQIVCGGSNVAPGMKVVVARPGAWVRWHGGGELIQMAQSKIRGVESAGMICAPAEIGFEKLPCGEKEIWDITLLTNAAAGTPIVEALDMDDTLFDIEITTNRPDCMSIVGLAREGGAAVHAPFSFTPPSVPTVGKSAPLAVNIEDGALCTRYMAAVIDKVKVAPSPWWLQKKLLLAGHRPINNIVDITNYVLHEYGQPLHAFDASKVTGKTINVRLAKKGEKLKTLEGKTVALKPNHLVIADAENPLAIAGIMGGLDSGTTEETTTVVFEAATFNALSIRKTSRETEVTSDSQLLFEKGLSTGALPQAMARAIALVAEIAGGQLVGDVIDVRPKPYEAKVFLFRPERARARIGIDIADDEMQDMLMRLGFAVRRAENGFMIEVPFWRDHDIEDEIDFTEEIARMYGYHLMPSVLPASQPPVEQDDASLKWESWLKTYCAAIGYTECFGHSLIGAEDLERYGFSPMDALKLHNPLSADQSHVRISLVPTMLRTIERNQAHTPAASIFELARVYLPRTNDLPDERMTLLLGEYGVTDATAAYMKLRGALELLARKSGLAMTFVRDEDSDRWHHGRTVAIMLGNQRIGTLGQVANAFQDSFGIHRPVFLAELDIECLIPQLRHVHIYTPVPEFPIVVRDISVVLGERIEFSDIVAMARASSSLVQTVGLVETYRGTEIESEKKSVTFSVTMGALDRTLTSEEVESVMNTIARELTLKFDGAIRS